MNRAWDAAVAYRGAFDARRVTRQQQEIALDMIYKSYASHMTMHAEADEIGEAAVKARVWQHPMQPAVESNARGKLVFQLKSQPWHDPSTLYPIEILEENMVEILAEAAQVLVLRGTDEALMEPADDYHDLADENSTGAWNELVLLRRGMLTPNRVLMPKTVEILSKIPEVASNTFGKVTLAFMEPGAVVKRHTSGTNLRIRIHCGLVVPEVL